MAVTLPAPALPASALVRGRSRLLTMPQNRSQVVNWIGFSLIIVVTLVAPDRD